MTASRFQPIQTRSLNLPASETISPETETKGFDVQYEFEITWPDGQTARQSIFNSFIGLSKQCDKEVVRPSLRLLFDPNEIEPGPVRDKVDKIVRNLFGQVPAKGITLPGSVVQLPRPTPQSIEVITVGTQVLIGGEIKGVITAVCIRERTTYEVVWWDGRTRKCEWLEEHEVEVVPPCIPAKMERIGFR